MKYLYSILILLFVSNVFAQVEESVLKSKGLISWEQTKHAKSLTGDNYDVCYHRLELSIDPRVRDMEGKVTTYFKPTVDNFNEIAFDFVINMQVDSVVYHQTQLNSFRNADLLRIPLSNTVANGQIDSLTVYYHGDPTNNVERSYERESGRAMSNAPMIWTLSEPYGAKYWWPCKQGLRDKIDSLDLLVTVPNGNKASGNGVLVGSYPEGDSLTTFHWKHRHKIATYLVATSVTNYDEFTDYAVFKNGDSLPIVNYVFPENKVNVVGPVKQAIPMLLLFDSLVGPYPFMDEKYGHAEFLRGGGMEHQTMSFMGSWNFGLIAHELAHQWFGNQITCGTWSDLWLNEGFATYFTIIAREHLQDRETWEIVQRGSQDRAMRESTESIYVLDTLDTDRLFSSHLTYNKGAQLLRMLHWKLGDSLFYKGIRNYLEDENLSYGFAETDDLIFHLESTSRQELSYIFDEWFYGTGNPHYDIFWKQSGKNISFQVKQSTNGDVPLFHMPFELKMHGGNESKTVVIDPTENEFKTNTTVDFAVDSITFDPDLWVLATSNILNQTDSSNTVLVFPNPVINEITISSFSNQLKTYKIYASNGQLVHESTISASPKLFLTIDLDFLRSGIYYLELSDGDSTSVHKLIKQ